MNKSSSREQSSTRSPNASPAPSTTPSTSDTPEKPESIPTAYLSDKAGTDDSSKLKTFLGILRKFIGVSDIASVRFSLPSQLLEPTPNLEYWNYLDRPETFISVNDSDEPLGRMLAVLRFWFTKDLKYIKGKPCKPYNSTLGEFFRCNWDVEAQHPDEFLVHQFHLNPAAVLHKVREQAEQRGGGERLLAIHSKTVPEFTELLGPNLAKA